MHDFDLPPFEEATHILNHSRMRLIMSKTDMKSNERLAFFAKPKGIFDFHCLHPPNLGKANEMKVFLFLVQLLGHFNDLSRHLGKSDWNSKQPDVPSGND